MPKEIVADAQITLRTMMLEHQQIHFLTRHGCTIQFETLTCTVVFPLHTTRTVKEVWRNNRVFSIIRFPDRTSFQEIHFHSGYSDIVLPEKKRWVMWLKRCATSLYMFCRARSEHKEKRQKT